MSEGQGELFPFALIPAAGRSRRMGAPKLLLDVGGQTVIARLLSALKRAGLPRPLVVIDPADVDLKAEVERQGGQAIVAEASPPDMKASVKIGLAAVQAKLRKQGVTPEPNAVWMLIPGDHPAVDSETVSALLAVARERPGKIIVPAHNGRRGHPTVFNWQHALEIGHIPEQFGINWILKRRAGEVVEVNVNSPGVLFDLDTPDDYLQLRRGGMA